MESYIIHYGTKNSGRYPRGSGENPHQHDGLRSNISNKQHSPVKIHSRRQYRGKYKNLSDEQLSSMINRLEKEKRLHDLYNDLNLNNNKSSVRKKIGKKFMDSIINGVSGGTGDYIKYTISNKAAVDKTRKINDIAYTQKKRLMKLDRDANNLKQEVAKNGNKSV